MFRKKFALALILMLLAALVLTACGGGEEATATPEPAEATAAPEEQATEAPEEEMPEVTGLVGIVLPTREEPRWIQDETRFRDALEAAGYDVEILFSQGDSAIELANVEQLITQGIQVLILTPQDGAAAAAAAEAARDAGVNVIAYDRLILNTDAVDYYVTFDSIAVGAAQGQYLVDHAEGSGNPVYLYAGAASDNNAFLFFEGAWNVLQPKIADGTFVIKNSSEAVALQDKAELTREEMGQIIGQITTEWDFDTAKSLAEANLTAAATEDKGDVFILAPNDGTARAIADAFAADADVSSYVVTGQDAEIASVQYIIDGKQSMTVLKDVRTLVGDAIAAAIAYLSGGAPEETNSYNNGTVDVPAKPSVVVSVDQSNVQQEIIDSGYWDASEFTGLDTMAEETMAEEEMATMPMGLDLSGTEIAFWHVWGTGSANEGMTAIIDDFNANNPWGITVVGVDQGNQGDLETAVNAAIASGDLPNVTPGFANSLANWYSVGVIKPLNEYINDSEVGLTAEELDAIYPGPYSQGTLPDGSQLGIPIHQSENVLFYNKTWAEELGFENPPATSAEFKEQICAATEFNTNDDDPDNDGTGGFVHYPGASNIANWAYAFGGDIVNEAGDNYDLNSPLMLEVAMFLKDIQDSGCTFATDTYPNPEFATRKALMVASSTAGIPFQAAAFEDAGNEDEWILIPFPGPDGNLAVNAFGQLIGVVDTTPEQDLASWLWLKHFTSPEVQAEWIRYSAYFPSQSTTLPLIEDYAAENPIWSQALEFGVYGKGEPNIPAHGAVRGEITDAFFTIAEAADEAAVQAILDNLQAAAEELVAETQ